MIYTKSYEGQKPNNICHNSNFKAKKPNKYDINFLSNLLNETRYKDTHKIDSKNGIWRQCWIEDVEEHTDDSKLVIVYCISGEGTFYLGNKYFHMKPGFFTVFNSTSYHSLEIKSTRVRTLVADVIKV